MPRDKGRKVERTNTPIRVQDQSGLERRLLDLLAERLITPLTERVELLEAAVAAIGVTVRRATIEFSGRRRSGTAVIPGAFLASQIGSPVLVTQAPSRTRRIDEAEGGLALLVGRVRSTTEFDVAWWSSQALASPLEIVYLC